MPARAPHRAATGPWGETYRPAWSRWLTATRFHALIARITTGRPATSASERWAEAAGARLVPVPIDNDGLVVEVGACTCRRSPGSRARHGRGGNALLLGYAGYDERQIRDGVGHLRTALLRLSGTAGPG